MKNLFAFLARRKSQPRRFIVSCQSGASWRVEARTYPQLYQRIADAVFGVTSVPTLQALAQAGWKRGGGAYGPMLRIDEIA